MERRFDYGLDELARRFDRSVSWISRRLALVEVLPEAIQQQVREGKILAQVAMKFLVPVARQSLEDCQRMAWRTNRYAEMTLRNKEAALGTRIVPGTAKPIPPCGTASSHCNVM